MKARPRNPAQYNRRNLLHCKSVGAVSYAKSALGRLRSQKRPPQWLVRSLEAIIERAQPVADEMAKHRNEAWR